MVQKLWRVFQMMGVKIGIATDTVQTQRERKEMSKLLRQKESKRISDKDLPKESEELWTPWRTYHNQYTEEDQNQFKTRKTSLGQSRPVEWYEKDI